MRHAPVLEGLAVEEVLNPADQRSVVGALLIEQMTKLHVLPLLREIPPPQKILGARQGVRCLRRNRRVVAIDGLAHLRIAREAGEQIRQDLSVWARKTVESQSPGAFEHQVGAKQLVTQFAGKHYLVKQASLADSALHRQLAGNLRVIEGRVLHDAVAGEKHGQPVMLMDGKRLEQGDQRHGRIDSARPHDVQVRIGGEQFLRAGITAVSEGNPMSASQARRIWHGTAGSKAQQIRFDGQPRSGDNASQDLTQSTGQ